MENWPNIYHPLKQDWSMTLAELIDSAKVVEADGQPVVQLDLAAWQELVELLETVSLPEQPPQTALGQQLLAARAQIIASGEPLLDWDDLKQEIAERRGGQE
jgi:hypothetical protein